jgi:hypothetical protein
VRLVDPEGVGADMDGVAERPGPARNGLLHGFQSTRDQSNGLMTRPVGTFGKK